MQDTYIDQGHCIFSMQISNQSVSCLLTVNWPEHFIRWGCFQIYSGNNNATLSYSAVERNTFKVKNSLSSLRNT